MSSRTFLSCLITNFQTATVQNAQQSEIITNLPYEVLILISETNIRRPNNHVRQVVYKYRHNR
jgi:hypothetical protein